MTLDEAVRRALEELPDHAEIDIMLARDTWMVGVQTLKHAWHVAIDTDDMTLAEAIGEAVGRAKGLPGDDEDDPAAR